ncbi:MAG: hypothetical protein IMZ41_02955 [Actinobacteria bacterium]|nr:hypothetical protein [Actinomycetota bacterium]
MTLDEFLENIDINEVDVTIQQDNTIFESGDTPGTAKATMENLLVPVITDQNKNIFWYILAGSFNISFSPSILISEANSKTPVAVTNPITMTDKPGTTADSTDPTASNYVSTNSDNYGEANMI